MVFYTTFHSARHEKQIIASTASQTPPNTSTIETNERESQQSFPNENQIVVKQKSGHSNQLTAKGKDVTSRSENSNDSSLIQPHPKKKAAVQKKKTKINQQQHCWRHCPQRINKIYFHCGTAGLGDKHTVIHMLAQMAGYLCAKLELPPPAASLNPAHNNNETFSKLVQWQDFFNLTFKQDRSPVVSLDSSFGEDFVNWEAMPVYDEDKYVDWLHIVQNSTDFVSAYRRLQEFSWSQEPNAKAGFIWEIHNSIYASNLFDKWLLPDPSEDTMQKAPEYNFKMQPYLTSYQYFHPNQKIHGCTYTNDEKVDTEPTHMKILRERIKRRVRRHGLENSIYGYLHIRRGDAIDDCDTSVEEIRDYLTCSLSGTETTGKNVTFVLGSDERDTAYRESIVRLADDFDHVTILDGDKLTKRVCYEAVINGLIREEIVDNNFYIYELQKIFWDGYNFTSMTLSRRRTGCPKCVPLMEYHASVWNS